MKNGSLTIGKLAKAAGVPISTIRYYEREGLLAAGERTSGNYRLYSGAALEKLRFLRAAQAAGLTLRDIRSMFEYREEGGSVCRDVQGLLQRRLEKVEEQLAYLQSVKGTLQQWVTECHERETSGRCGFIGSLDKHAQAEPEEEKSKKCSDCS